MVLLAESVLIQKNTFNFTGILYETNKKHMGVKKSTK